MPKTPQIPPDLQSSQLRERSKWSRSRRCSCWTSRAAAGVRNGQRDDRQGGGRRRIRSALSPGRREACRIGWRRVSDGRSPTTRHPGRHLDHRRRPRRESGRRGGRVGGWVRARAQKARRTASVCTGAHLLAATGMLDGRRAATHWSFCDDLARSFPAVRVESDPIFVRDGSVWTSAGVTPASTSHWRWWRRTSGGLWPGRRAVSGGVPQEAGGQAKFSAALSLQPGRSHSASSTPG